MRLRYRKLLSASAVTLGLLSGSLTTAQATPRTSPVSLAQVAITSKTTTAEAKAACDARLKAARDAGSTKPVACLTWGTKPPAGDRQPAITAWPTPNWCDDHGADNNWYVTRFKACGVFSADLTVHDTRTGRVTGTMHYLAVGYAYSKRDIKAWASRWSWWR
ncbi:hypothetical protein ABZ478_20145 [Streptomyces sp. NPDC005706]|uniref:hypothetical protein n=1 Tax=Streptomyces sp. NPDC005706 TaxID=3157169 RepID=UPI00340AF0C2